MVHGSASTLLSIDETSHVILFQGLGITLRQRSGPDKEQIIIKTLIPEGKKMRKEKKKGGKLG